mmetsp:Transcript_81003/g.194318  ORF Transcript_81003/g.194318 Transcript_81003/m.194318 type:complete len:123 (+) Transcript_81003:2262-2630(+)
MARMATQVQAAGAATQVERVGRLMLVVAVATAMWAAAVAKVPPKTARLRPGAVLQLRGRPRRPAEALEAREAVASALRRTQRVATCFRIPLEPREVASSLEARVQDVQAQASAAKVGDFRLV